MAKQFVVIERRIEGNYFVGDSDILEKAKKIKMEHQLDLPDSDEETVVLVGEKSTKGNRGHLDGEFVLNGQFFKVIK